MNQQVKPSTQEVPQANISPPEITSLGSQEAVVANIGEIFDDPPATPTPTESISPVVPIKETVSEPEGRSTEILNPEVPAESAESVPAPVDNLLTNSLEPVMEEESPPLHDPATVARLHRDIQKMIQEHQYSGAEQEVIHERIENTGKISLS